MYERTLKNDCIPTTHTYLLSLGHVSVALGTDRAGWFRRLQGSTVHLQPSQITAPEAALIHDACLRCPPNAGAVACGLVCTKQSGPGVRQSCLHPQSPIESQTPLFELYQVSTTPNVTRFLNCLQQCPIYYTPLDPSVFPGVKLHSCKNTFTIHFYLYWLWPCFQQTVLKDLVFVQSHLFSVYCLCWETFRSVT